MLDRDLKDPAFRAEWERTQRTARSMSSGTTLVAQVGSPSIRRACGA